MTEQKFDRLVWIDLEMTGLDPHNDVIVEVAAVVTDADLNVLGSNPNSTDSVDIVVHASDEQLAAMDPYVTEMHRASGLTEEIKAATATIEQAEDAVLELIARHCDPMHPAPLAGNSIATDRAFIREYMPRLDKALHYRMVDVSSVKELTRRWFPKAYYQKPEKGMNHRALADIIESVAELDYYRRAVFVNDPGPDTDAATSAAQATTQAFKPLLENL